MRAPGLIVMLAIMLVGFSAAARDFATPGNALNVLLQSSVLLLIALPMTFVILTEGLDLSIGAVLSLCSVTLALTAVATGSFAAALAVALAGRGARRRAQRRLSSPTSASRRSSRRSARSASRRASR